jgi:hypothetical protein
MSAHDQSEISIDMKSEKRPESSLNKSIHIKDLKHHLGGGAQISFKNMKHRKNSDTHD